VVEALNQVFSLMVPSLNVKADGIVAPSSRASKLDIAVLEQARRKGLVLKHAAAEFVGRELEAFGCVTEEPQPTSFEWGKDIAIHKALKRWSELGRKSRFEICYPGDGVVANGPLPIIGVRLALFGDARSNLLLEEKLSIARVDHLYKPIDQFVGVERASLSHVASNALELSGCPLLLAGIRSSARLCENSLRSRVG